jgi:hypothetical protein
MGSKRVGFYFPKDARAKPERPQGDRANLI